MNQINEKELLRYEVYSSFWANLIWFEWGQDLAAKYYARKTYIKYQRYMKRISEMPQVEK